MMALIWLVGQNYWTLNESLSAKRKMNFSKCVKRKTKNFARKNTNGMN